MKRFSMRVWLGWFLLLISLVLLIWGFFPYKRERREMRILPQEMQLPSMNEVVPNALRFA